MGPRGGGQTRDGGVGGACCHGYGGVTVVSGFTVLAGSPLRYCRNGAGCGPVQRRPFASSPPGPGLSFEFQVLTFKFRGRPGGGLPGSH